MRRNMPTAYISMRPSLQQVDMFDACTLRHFSSKSALAATEMDARVRSGRISLVPWWLKARMLVLVPGGGRNPDVLRRVVSNICGSCLSAQFSSHRFFIDISQAASVARLGCIELIYKKPATLRFIAEPFKSSLRVRIKLRGVYPLFFALSCCGFLNVARV